MNQKQFLAICAIELRQIAISMAVGAGASILYAIGRPNAELTLYAIAGAFVGFCIYLVISLMSQLFRRFIRMLALNDKLSVELGRREFVALVCARFDPATGVVEVANGGCPDPYLITSKGAEMLTCDGIRLPLGVNPTVEYSIATRRIEPGARLLFVSDGIPEAPITDGQPIGYETLTQIISQMSNSDDRGAAWLDRLLQLVRSRVVATLDDDWTAVLLERSAAS